MRKEFEFYVHMLRALRVATLQVLVDARTRHKPLYRAAALRCLTDRAPVHVTQDGKSQRDRRKLVRRYYGV